MEIQQINIKELRPFVKGSKNHSGNQMSILKQSLQDFGWTNHILITSDKMVEAGHARLQAFLELGLFGGFGTIQIELHQLDPRYCDAILQRYVNLTGNCELKRNGEIFTWESQREAQ
ncbi:hypothetical protein Mpsy_0566 [Methanolobus psychrophilus R15]|nr:hypothetical protein Mpsy_0566 [Methanolobus psychrophilus R15]